jgi:hypothetical protein
VVALPAHRPTTMRHDAYDVLQVTKSWLTRNETKNAVMGLSMAYKTPTLADVLTSVSASQVPRAP